MACVTIPHSMHSLDPFDLVATQTQHGAATATIWALTKLAPLRFAGHVLLPESAMTAFKNKDLHCP